MASTLTLYYATDAKNDEIRMTNDKTMPNSPKGWLSAFFRFDHSFVLRHLIHIALVPLVTFEFFNVFIGFLGVFLHPVLDVNLLGLIARPRAIEPCQNSLLQIRLEFISVSKIALLVLRSEEEPVFSFRPDRFSLLQIRAERRNAGPWTDHDNRRVRVFRQVKVFCHTGEDGHRRIVSAFRQKRRANSFAQPAMTFVTDDVHNEVHLVGERHQARGH